MPARQPGAAAAAPARVDGHCCHCSYGATPPRSGTRCIVARGAAWAPVDVFCVCYFHNCAPVLCAMAPVYTPNGPSVIRLWLCTHITHHTPTHLFVSPRCRWCAWMTRWWLTAPPSSAAWQQKWRRGAAAAAAVQLGASLAGEGMGQGMRR